MDKDLLRIAEIACEAARKRGAQQTAAAVRRTRSCKVVIRDGKNEELKSAESRNLSLRVFVDGRYAQHSTSNLADAALARFVSDAVEMTRYLMPDRHRSLPDPSLYRDRSRQDLRIFDPDHDKLTMAERKRVALAVHDAARAAAGALVISVGAGFSDDLRESVLLQSNGFSDGERSTTHGQWADVTVKDPAGKRPSDWAESMARRRGELGDPARTGAEAARRALAAVGAQKLSSRKLPLIVESRCVDVLLGGLLRPLDGWALDQKQSCFAESLDKAVAAELLTITDDPLLAGGWGSRRFDDEGLTGRRRPIIERGALRAFYVDTSHGKKLGRSPTTSDSSNLVFAPGEKDLDGLCAEAGDAVLVTSFLGGNSNSTTGDFSHGISGFLVEKGKRSRPLASMNVAANHTDFWKTLLALGNDPYAHSSHRTPSLLFDALLVAGK
jgi:PmbA protein